MSLALLILLVATAAAWCAALVCLTAWRAVRPPRMTDGKALYLLKRLSPNDLGLTYLPMQFDIRDEHGRPLTIAGWWIPTPAPSARTVIFLHGYGDAKVGSIAWASTWLAVGWNVLAIDQRAHGESGGKFCTGGYFERDDVDQVIDQIRVQQPSATAEIALFGVSLGTGTATAVAARRADLAAVVLDSPFADYRNAIRSHLRRLRSPLVVLHPAVVKLAESTCSARWSQTRPVDLIANIACPVLIIRGHDDDFVSHADLAALKDAIQVRSQGHDGGQSGQVEEFFGAHHTLSIQSDPNRYQLIIQRFMLDAMHPADRSISVSNVVNVGPEDSLNHGGLVI